MIQCLPTNKAEIVIHIENMVKTDNLTYLEATTQFLEENGYECSSVNKNIPKAIIERIKLEAIEGNLVKPSVIANLSDQVALDEML